MSTIASRCTIKRRIWSLREISATFLLPSSPESPTIVMRAGLPNRVLYASVLQEGSWKLEGESSLAYGVTIEPRIYTSLNRRIAKGKKTLKNSSDFVAFRLQGTLGTPNYPTAEICLVPMYGIRRVWGEHWFGEFTVGGGMSYHNLFGWDMHFKPHMQYRVGFVF